MDSLYFCHQKGEIRMVIQNGEKVTGFQENPDLYEKPLALEVQRADKVVLCLGCGQEIVRLHTRTAIPNEHIEDGYIPDKWVKVCQEIASHNTCGEGNRFARFLPSHT